jgi:O-antigen ligase
LQQTKNNASIIFHERLYLYSLLFFTALLPFQFNWLPLTLGLMLYSLVWLITLRFGEKFKRLGRQLPALVSLAYLAWVAVGTLYSEVPDVSIKILTLKVPFGAWAILMSSSGLVGRKVIVRVMHTFVYGLAIASVFALVQFGFGLLSGGGSTDFGASQILRFYQVPSHYFGLYLNFAYGLVLAWFLKRDYLLQKPWLSLLVLTLFLFMIILLSVRMQYLVFFAVNFLVLFMAGRKPGITHAVRLVLIPLVLLLLGLAAFPGPRNRLMDSFNELVSFREMINNKQTNPRKFLWRDGFMVVRENVLFGTGTGAADAALHDKLKDEKAVFWDGKDTFTLADTSYNYHNAYLQHWAANGLVGLALLLALFLLPLIRRKVGVEEAIFLLACAMSFLTESMLQRQAGVLFFTLFYGVFFFVPRDEFQEVEKEK